MRQAELRLGDGAAWIWGMAEDLYPHATHITDIHHAREHLHDLAAHLAFITPDPPQWLEDRKADLDAGNIDAIIEAASCYSLAGVKPTSWSANSATSVTTPTVCASILALRTQHTSGRRNDFIAPEHTPPAGPRTAV